MIQYTFPDAPYIFTVQIGDNEPQRFDTITKATEYIDSQQLPTNTEVRVWCGNILATMSTP